MWNVLEFGESGREKKKRVRVRVWRRKKGKKKKKELWYVCGGEKKREKKGKKKKEMLSQYFHNKF